MGAVSMVQPHLPAMTGDALDKVRALESEMAQHPQVEMPTQHLLHAGLYARTICIPAGVLLSGALIKRATVLVIQGDCTVFIGDETLRLDGYHVLPASAGRKQVFWAHADTHVTMLFPTDAQSVDQSEREFTDEYDRLMSCRQGYQGDRIMITGE